MSAASSMGCVFGSVGRKPQDGEFGTMAARYRMWQSHLPGLVAAASARFGIVPAEPYEGGAAGFVAPADAKTVLKISFPHREAKHEPDALELIAGDGAPKLLARADDLCAMLLERIEPGRQLWTLPEEVANPIAAEVLRRFWRPLEPDHGFRSLASEAFRWAAELPMSWKMIGQPCARRLLDEAVAQALELGASIDEQYLLHQDLHGGNVLESARGWLAIDPKPIAGEREFDLASLLRDRRFELARDPSPLRTIRRRFDLLTDALHLDRARARGWAIVHALAWGIGSREHVACAELFQGLDT